MKMKKVKRVKRVLSAAAVLSLTLGLLSGCGGNETSSSGETEAEDKGSVYCISPMSGGVSWGPCQEGFEQACEELGYEANWVTPSSTWNVAEMVQLTESALLDGAKALIVLPPEESAFADVLTRATESGVAVISLNGTISKDYSNAWIGTDPVTCGQVQAEAVMAEFEPEDEINLVYLQTQFTVPTQNQQYETMVKELQDNGYNVNVKEEWRGECKADAATTSDMLSAMTKASPEINCVVMSDGMGSIGVKSYIEETGKDDLVVIGIDDDAPVLNAVKDGTFSSTVVQNFRGMGYEGVYLCDKILNGEDYDYDNDTGTSILYADDVDARAKEIGIELE